MVTYKANSQVTPSLGLRKGLIKPQKLRCKTEIASARSGKGPWESWCRECGQMREREGWRGGQGWPSVPGRQGWGSSWQGPLPVALLKHHPVQSILPCLGICALPPPSGEHTRRLGSFQAGLQEASSPLGTCCPLQQH